MLDEKHSSDGHIEEKGFDQASYSEFEDKPLLRKIDFKLIPFLALLYLLSFLDRVNIGIAKLSGLEKSLGLVGNQYNIALLVFFVGYVILETPSTIALRYLRPSRFIPFIMTSWGLIMLCMGFVTDFNGLAICRFFLGLSESALFPGICFYLTNWYRREETSFRIALFFSSATLAGAFGGLIGYGLSLMAGDAGLQGWSWIFIIEGGITMAVGLASFFVIQDFPAESTFLSVSEKERVLLRLRIDHGAAGDIPFDWQHIRNAFKDWRVATFVFLYVTIATPLYALSLFIPTIVSSLGVWTRPQSVLLSTPPFFFAFFVTLTSSWYSDRVQNRGYFNIFFMSWALTGFAILLSLNPLTNPGASYFALFLCVGGVSPCIPNAISWCGNNNGPVYKKATAMGLFFTFGNSGGIIASTVYIAADAPHYIHGHGVMAGMCAASILTASLLTWNVQRENKRRDALYGTASSHLPAAGEVGFDQAKNDAQMQTWGLVGMSNNEILALGDRHPGFRYYP